MKKLITLILSALLFVSMMTAFPLNKPATVEFAPGPITTDAPNEPVESEEPGYTTYDVPDLADNEH